MKIFIWCYRRLEENVLQLNNMDMTANPHGHDS